MIIGLCGQAGSGKDAVADAMVRNHGFVKVALADPLKRICREVYDFTDDQLWGPSAARNAPDKRYLRKPASVEEQYTYAGRVTLMDGTILEGGTRITHRIENPDEYLTPRYALQKLGTEWGRDCYPNTWVDLALRTAQALLSEDPIIRPTYSAQRGLDYTDIDAAGRRPGNGGRVRGVVISDVRFRNEVDALRASNSRVVRVTRKGAQGLAGAQGQHVSETEQLAIPDALFDSHFLNAGDGLDRLAMATAGLVDALFRT
jgi:hypothetical protein